MGGRSRYQSPETKEEAEAGTSARRRGPRPGIGLLGGLNDRWWQRWGGEGKGQDVAQVLVKSDRAVDEAVPKKEPGRKSGFHLLIFHAFIHLLEKKKGSMSSLCCISRIVLGLGYKSVNKTARYPCPQAVSVAKGKADNRQSTYKVKQ